MKDRVKAIFREAGADLCGVANVEAFAGTPEGFRPTDIYPACRSVVVFAKPVPKGTTVVSPRIVYQHFNELGPHEIDRIAYQAANRIEAELDGALVVPIPADGPYDYWVADKKEGRGILSMKHAAVLAGLGVLGKSTLLLNATYGNMLCIGAVLTNLDLPSDPPAENICPDHCRICINGCPVGAISEHGVDQLLCREHTYTTNSRGFAVVNCNRCRAGCPRVFGCKPQGGEACLKP